jgi:transposase InsO family protein
LPNQTAPATAAAIEALRRLRAKQIAADVGVSAATVSRILRRLGLNRLSALEPAEPIRRYEREKPGELIHIDIKKLGRIGSVGHRITERQTGAVNRHLGIGWEFVHVCIDDASRIACSQVMKDEKKESAVAFLKAAVAYYASLGVRIERVMTDNGSCYRSKAFSRTCKMLGLKHIRTKPYTPKTNGKAERFIQTSLRKWAYARAYNTSDERIAELPRWLHRCNWHRPHGSIGAKPPISRLGLAGNNLLRLHSLARSTSHRESPRSSRTRGRRLRSIRSGTIARDRAEPTAFLGLRQRQRTPDLRRGHNQAAGKHRLDQ